MCTSSKDIFHKYDGRASKKFGQNYIFSVDVNKRIVDLCGDLSGKRVIEIGPGPGGLTLEIIKRKPLSLTLIELDSVWCDAWSSLMSDFDMEINLIRSDALKVDFNDLNSDIVISNLPYNISSQVLFKLLPDMHKYKKLVLMFQKELADRILAREYCKDYGKLSVLSQWKANIIRGITLPPACFSPPPKVYSSVLVFEPYKQQNSWPPFEKVNSLLTQAFANRRKQVFKSISHMFGDLEKVFFDLDIKMTARAEEISLNKFMKILSCMHTTNYDEHRGDYGTGRSIKHY